MKMTYEVSPIVKKEVVKLYTEGFSAQEIKEQLQISHSLRQVQRWIKKEGIMRNIGDAFRNAVKRGRVHFAFKENKIRRKKLSPKLRYLVLQRDNFKCVKCGQGALQDKLLEVDHIDNDKNNSIPSNLQTLCHECNFGKSLVVREISRVK